MRRMRWIRVNCSTLSIKLLKRLRYNLLPPLCGVLQVDFHFCEFLTVWNQVHDELFSRSNIRKKPPLDYYQRKVSGKNQSKKIFRLIKVSRNAVKHPIVLATTVTSPKPSSPIRRKEVEIIVDETTIPDVPRVIPKSELHEKFRNEYFRPLFREQLADLSRGKIAPIYSFMLESQIKRKRKAMLETCTDEEVKIIFRLDDESLAADPATYEDDPDSDDPWGDF